MHRSPRARLSHARLVAQPLVGLLIGLAVLTGCGDSTEVEPAAIDSETPRASAVASVRPVRDLDSDSLRHLSLLLAGVLPEHERDDLDPAWRRHAEEIEALWSRYEPRLESMESWARRDAPSLASSPALVFVPFAEGDLSTALRLFPEAVSYLLVGLEPPGRLLLPEEMEPDELPRGALMRKLEGLRDRIATTAGLEASPASNARSAVAGDRPRNEPLSGALPLLLTSLVRDGRLPLEVQYVQIDPESLQVAPLPEDRPEAHAVRVVFATLGPSLLLDGDDLAAALAAAPRRTVYYIASNLADTALFPDAPLRRLLAAQPSFRVFLQSTDFRPHQPDHSTLRELLLDHADAVLQDESGLPLRSFTSDTWSIELFGGYRGGSTVTKRWFQADLAAAYERSEASPLPFVLGPRGGAALILARRLPEPSAASS